MKRRIVLTGAFIGMLAIVLGAFGAHLLKKYLSVDQLNTFEVGVRYQMYHALFLLFLSTQKDIAEKMKQCSGCKKNKELNYFGFKKNNNEFKKQFNEIYPNYKDNLGLQVWNERLNFEGDKIALGSKNEILAVMVFILIGGLVANIPNITDINEESFFSKNVALLVFSILSAYFIWRQQINLNKKK